MQNVDPLEISKFSELAHRWWDTESEFKALHDINPLRVEYINRYARLSEKQTVDVGCGGGILSEAMAREGARVTGIDLAQASLDVAELHALESGLEVSYLNISVEAFAEDHGEAFDIVTCLEMLEHVPDPASVVEHAAKLARPGGWVFFSTLNRNVKSWAMAIAGAEYLLQLIPRGTHQYQRFLKPSELGGFVRRSQLQIRDITGLTYNPLLKQYKLGKDVDVNYLMACQKR